MRLSIDETLQNGYMPFRELFDTFIQTGNHLFVPGSWYREAGSLGVINIDDLITSVPNTPCSFHLVTT